VESFVVGNVKAVVECVNAVRTTQYSRHPIFDIIQHVRLSVKLGIDYLTVIEGTAAHNGCQ
jgi:hypothetical protein